MAKVDEYLALPDHPEYDSTRDDEEDQAFKDGTWKDDDEIEMDRALDWKFKRIRGVQHPEPGEDFSFDEWKAGLSSKKRDTNYGRQTEILRHEYTQVNLEKEFRDRGLQVIVKLASVELTPEKPEYSGGNWHLEVSRIASTSIQENDTDISQGMMNERKHTASNAKQTRLEEPLH
jgi:hypothetical protein